MIHFPPYSSPQKSANISLTLLLHFSFLLARKTPTRGRSWPPQTAATPPFLFLFSTTNHPSRAPFHLLPPPLFPLSSSDSKERQQGYRHVAPPPSSVKHLSTTTINHHFTTLCCLFCDVFLVIDSSFGVVSLV